MQTGYFIKYRIYDINNTIVFHGSSQYINWTYVMENNFAEQFEVISIEPFVF